MFVLKKDGFMVFKNELRGGVMKIVEVDFNYENIFGEYLERFIDFCFQISDEVELVESYSKRITYEEYEQARGEAEEYFSDKEFNMFDEISEEEMIACYRRAGETEEKIHEYITDFRIQNDPRLLYVCTSEEIQELVHKEFREFGLIKREVTYHTHCTMSGQPAVVYTFELRKQLKNQFLKMEEVFSPVFVQEGNIYIDDPAFYRNGRLIVSICSHERYGTMYLTEEEYEKFKLYRVPHIVEENCWWLQETLDNDETVRIIINSSVELGGLLGPSYLLNDLPAWEERVKIYEEYRKLPPIQYEAVEMIVLKLSRKYRLTRFNSDEIQKQISTNIANNRCLAKHIMSKSDIKVDLYEIEYRGKKLFLGVEINSGYIVVDSFETLTKIQELRSRQNEEQNKPMYSFVTFCFDSECKPDVYPVECQMLCDEISLIRGLDEFEQRDIESVNYYDFVKRRVKRREVIVEPIH